jgi:predicted RNA binding protein YcfA (HicA-like mRNA interferase family)
LLRRHDQAAKLKPRAVIEGLRRSGFVVVRVRGSHYQLANPTTGRRVTVPYHNHDLTRAILASIIHQSGLTTQEFIDRL